MNTLGVLCVMISLSAAAPTSEDAQSQILSYNNNNDGKGNYEFSFETSNGISRMESGRLVNAGELDEHLEVQGVYSYTDTEGHIVFVRYTADENGYHINADENIPPILVPVMPIQGALPSAAVASLLG